PRSIVPKWNVHPEAVDTVRVSLAAPPSVSVTVTTPLPVIDCEPLPLQLEQMVDSFSAPSNVIATVSPDPILCVLPPFAAITEALATGAGTGTVPLTARVLPTLSFPLRA